MNIFKFFLLIILFSCSSPNSKPSIWSGEISKAEHKAAYKLCMCTNRCFKENGYNIDLLNKNSAKIKEDVDKVIKDDLTICEYLLKWQHILDVKRQEYIFSEKKLCNCDTVITSSDKANLDMGYLAIYYFYQCNLSLVPIALETHIKFNRNVHTMEDSVLMHASVECEEPLREFFNRIKQDD